MINPERVVQSRSYAAGAVDQGLRAHMLKVYNYMVAGLAITGVIAAYIANNPAMLQQVAQYQMPLFLVLLGMGIAFPFVLDKISTGAGVAYFFTYATVMGVITSLYFYIYTNESIARAFFMSAGLFAMMSIYGYTTKKDLTSWAGLLTAGMIVVLIGSFVNYFFFQSSAAVMAMSAIVVLLSAGITAYSTQSIRDLYYTGMDKGKLAVLGALTLYINFINMFLAMLRLFGNQR